MRAILLPLLSMLLISCIGDDNRRTLRVNKTDITLSITSTGELASSQTIELGAPTIKHTWRYKISYLIPEGSWVKKGEKVLEFDAQKQFSRQRDLQNSLAIEKQRLRSQALDNKQQHEQLKLDLAAAKNELDRAKAKATHIDKVMAQLEVKKLQLNQKIHQENYSMARYRLKNHLQKMEMDHEIVLSEVQRLTAELNEQQKAILATKVKAPRDGIVVYKIDHEGNKLAEGDEVTPVKKVVELPDLNSLIVKTTIAEHEAFKIHKGNKVNIQFDAIPERMFSGRVESFGNIVRVRSQQEPRKVFDVTINLENPDASIMRPGMAARLSIIYDQAKSVFAIPQQAIIYRNNRAYVRIKTLWGEKEIEIKVVARQEGHAIVSQGLSNGDVILL